MKTALFIILLIGFVWLYLQFKNAPLMPDDYDDRSGHDPDYNPEYISRNGKL